MNYKLSDLYRKYRHINKIEFETENQAYSSFSGLVVFQKLFAHLNLKLQMRTQPKERATTGKRAALWAFEKMGTFRKKMIQRAGRITKPGGVITLTMGGNQAVKDLISTFLTRLEATA